jgi:hypothetical protein
MNLLEKTKRDIEKRLNIAETLQKYRNIDFPKNSLLICKNNLYFLNDYFINKMCNPKYRFTLDTIIVTHIINYLDCIKSYLNRKKRAIQRKPECVYKNDILLLVEKTWSKKHAIKTNVDKLIKVRDEFEHEEINDLQFVLVFDKEKIVYKLKFHSDDFIQLCIDAYQELVVLNNEINYFIESKISECNIRECVLFKLSFSKRFKDGYECDLFPEPTNDEIKYYDDLISRLYQK